MTHSFKPVTTGEAIQVAILDELQQIRGLLEPSPAPEPAELPQDEAADAPAEKPAPAAKKAPAKKATTRKVTGQ